MRDEDGGVRINVSDQASFVNNAYIKITIPSECPTPYPASGTIVQTVLLGGRSFTAVENDEGAAGTQYDTITFSSRISLSRCLVLEKTIGVNSVMQETESDRQRAEQQKAAMQETLKNVLKTIVILPTPFSTEWLPYQNHSDGYSMEYPSDWTVQSSDAGTAFLAEHVDLGGAKGVGYSGTINHFAVAIEPSCPDLFRIFEFTPNPSSAATVNVDGRVFSSTLKDDAAMGSYQRAVLYTSKKDDTHCIGIVLNMFYGDPSRIEDSKERSARERALDDMKALLDHMLHSFRAE